MELEHLKETWAALDNRLKRNKEISERIILEMMKSRVGKKMNWIVAWEMFSVVVLILLVPLNIYLYDLLGGKSPTWDALILFGVAICFLYPFWGVYKIQGLMKFDLAKSVSNNTLCMNRYNIRLKRERRVVTYFLLPVLVILSTIQYAIVKATLPLWIFGTCVFILAVLICYWSYKKYTRDIDSILRSLDEIDELKEE